MKLKVKYYTLIIIFSILFIFPSIEIKADSILSLNEKDWVLGDKEAPITMIEYASLSCPHCAAFHVEKLPIIKKEYIDTGKVKLIFRDFPLNLPALQGSMISRCVGEDLHFKYLDALFNLQRSWVSPENSKELLYEIVETGGISRDFFEACLGDKDLENQILSHQLKAQREYNITTTPSFIINGKLISGSKSLDTFRKIFDEILSE